MTPLKLLETRPGSFSLLLDAGTTQVDALVQEHGHEPNGYFWEGLARFLVTTEAPSLENRFSYDPEGSMFCAYGSDRPALEALAALLSKAATTPSRMESLITAAKAANVDFDD
ncbi:Imm51 family immunity protein [Spirillospora sp. NPDC052269]